MDAKRGNEDLRKDHWHENQTQKTRSLDPLKNPAGPFQVVLIAAARYWQANVSKTYDIHNSNPATSMQRAETKRKTYHML